MKNMDEQDEIIIVGAGPGGLASSLLLAQAGLKVKVFEKRTEQVVEQKSSKRMDSSLTLDQHFSTTRK